MASGPDAALTLRHRQFTQVDVSGFVDSIFIESMPREGHPTRELLRVVSSVEQSSAPGEEVDLSTMHALEFGFTSIPENIPENLEEFVQTAKQIRRQNFMGSLERGYVSDEQQLPKSLYKQRLNGAVRGLCAHLYAGVVYELIEYTCHTVYHLSSARATLKRAVDHGTSSRVLANLQHLQEAYQQTFQAGIFLQLSVESILAVAPGCEAVADSDIPYVRLEAGFKQLVVFSTAPEAVRCEVCELSVTLFRPPNQGQADYDSQFESFEQSSRLLQCQLLQMSSLELSKEDEQQLHGSASTARVQARLDQVLGPPAAGRSSAAKNHVVIELGWSDMEMHRSVGQEPGWLVEVEVRAECLLFVLSRAYRDSFTQIVTWQNSQLSRSQREGKQVLAEIFEFQKDMWAGWIANMARVEHRQHRVEVNTDFPVGLKLVGKESGHLLIESPHVVIAPGQTSASVEYLAGHMSMYSIMTLVQWVKVLRGQLPASDLAFDDALEGDGLEGSQFQVLVPAFENATGEEEEDHVTQHLELQLLTPQAAGFGGSSSVGGERVALLSPSMAAVAWFADQGEFQLNTTGLQMTISDFNHLHERNSARIAKTVLKQYNMIHPSHASPTEQVCDHPGSKVEIERQRLEQAVVEAEKYTRLTLDIAVERVEVSTGTAEAERCIWLLFVTKGLDYPFFKLVENRTDEGKTLNKIGLELGAPTVLQVCWSMTSIQQTYAVVRGIIKHAMRSPLDVEDRIGAALLGLRLDIVNLWPTCGILNRTGATTGITTIKQKWHCGVHILLWTVFAIWFVLSFDMVAAIFGLVFALSYGLNCAFWTSNNIYALDSDPSTCPSGWVLFTSVVPLSVICVVMLPSLMHSIWRYWSRTFAIAAGLLAWGLTLWYRSL